VRDGLPDKWLGVRHLPAILAPERSQ
jgi:hypothetical protein